MPCRDGELIQSPHQGTLEHRLSSILSKRKIQSKLRTLKSSPPGAIDFSSNDFLSLATTPAFRQSYLDELMGSDLPIGSTGSRLLDGNSAYAEDLEQKIAAFHGAETGLLVNSGFDANVSIFTVLPQPGDAIVYDELVHASVHDGMRSSRVKERLPFRHNDVEDFRVQLEKARKRGGNVFVAVESVYSMDGDVAPLAGMVAVAKDVFGSRRDCYFVVDEAHATGVLGRKGRGLVCELGLEREIFVRLHTFGKALAAGGAVILCPKVVREYLINYARPLIFTTFMPYPVLVAAKVAYDWLMEGRTEQLASNVKSLTTLLCEQLKRLGHEAQSRGGEQISLLHDQPDSPILALLTKKPRELAAHCQSRGFVVRPVVHPTVPQGTERVRICLHAGNTEQEVFALVECVRDWLVLSRSADQGMTKVPPRSSSGSTSVLSPPLRYKL